MGRAAAAAREQRAIAGERILTLFGEAAKAAAAGRLDRANRYAHLAWKLHTRFKAPIPLALRRRFCRKCLSYWLPGRTVRVRMRGGKAVYTCLACKERRRVPLR
jgi:ribonuclease P protein subunit RPR2